MAQQIKEQAVRTAYSARLRLRVEAPGAAILGARETPGLTVAQVAVAREAAAVWEVVREEVRRAPLRVKGEGLDRSTQGAVAAVVVVPARQEPPEMQVETAARGFHPQYRARVRLGQAVVVLALPQRITLELPPMAAGQAQRPLLAQTQTPIKAAVAGAARTIMAAAMAARAS